MQFDRLDISLSHYRHLDREHRAHIACALEVGGFHGFALDDIDLWAFEVHERGSA